MNGNEIEIVKAVYRMCGTYVHDYIETYETCYFCIRYMKRYGVSYDLQNVMSDTKTFSQITIHVISIILKAPFVKRVSNEMHQTYEFS